MEKDSNLYNLTQSVQGQVFYAAFMTNLTQEQRDDWTNRPPVMNLKRGYAESPNWIFVQALEFAPEALTVERFRKRAVYAAPKLTLGLLELLASEQYFDRIGDEYHLTEKGHAQANKVRDFRITAFEGFEPIDASDIGKLVGYMARIIDASLQADKIWCLEHSRNRAPKDDAAPLAKLIQFGSDLNAFRDDAHMAAFGAHNVEGHVWEAFSYIQSEQAKNAAELYEKLAYRGFYSEDWQAALDDLASRGWIAKNGDTYTITKTGLAIAADVEAKTNEYFYAPWAVLSDEEYDELIMLIQYIGEKSQALTAQPA